MGEIKNKLILVYKIFKLLISINWITTVYLNFKTQSTSTALKFPIIVFGSLKVYTLTGNLKIKGNIHFGMVQFGKDMDHMPISSTPIKLRIQGELILSGKSIICGGAVIEVLEGSKMEIDQYCIICSGVYLKSENHIKIGKGTRITSGCFVMDTDMHSIRNTISGHVKKRNSPIVIKEHCWIGMNSTILKGTTLPVGSMVGRNSFLNKDYSGICSEFSFLVGVPASERNSNVQRVWSLQEEVSIREYFKENPNKNIYKSGKGIFEYSDEDLGYDFKLI